LGCFTGLPGRGGDLGKEVGRDFHVDGRGLIWLIICEHMANLTPHQIEAATALGWPAQDEANIAGWRVFSGLGPVGRVNSCWPLAFVGDDVDAAIDQVEAHYRAKSLPPQFKLIVDCEVPAGLSGRLIARGYQTTSHVAVMTAYRDLLSPQHNVLISPCVTDAFADVVTETSPTPLDGQERADILRRVPNPSAFGSVSVNGELVAVGLATFTGDSAGIAAMRTTPSHRQKGYARSILRAVARAARAAGATTLWLQVETDNLPAVRLYESEGFGVDYHYKTMRLV
jgi:N-acetylglutamate synthase